MGNDVLTLILGYVSFKIKEILNMTRIVHYGCYGYFFWETEFNGKCKNHGYNVNLVCNILNF